jgi:hypothetical protein
MLRIVGGLVFLFVAVALVPAFVGGQPPGKPPPVPGSEPAGAEAQPPQPPAPAEQTTLIRLATSPRLPKTHALKYQLVPDALDLTPGNAATIWMRAGRSAATTTPKMLERESKWLGPADTPLKDFPKADVREFLGKYTATLRLADEAARKSHCDWELPPLTLQSMSSYQLDDVQLCREIANLLTLECRLQLSDGDFDGALRTLQTGFALARHVGQGDTLVQNLVGIAIAHVMLGRVEEMMQLPDSPDLYWALTALPSPFIDLRPTMNSELNLIYRSFPQLRKLDTLDATPPEFEKFVNEMFDELAKTGGQSIGGVEGKLVLTALVLKTYPDAKRWLIAQGRPEEKVKALPALQVVLLYQLDQYNALRDEIVAAFSLPAWQANAALDRVDKTLRTYRAEGVVNPFILLLLPAMTKVHESDARLQRMIASLRVAESLRWYAAAHDGKVPDILGDVRDLPAVIDPQTGRGFDAFYKVADATAVLDVPPPAHMPASVGRRFELKAAR